MKYLLDTHTFIWSILDSSKLSDRVKEIIEDSNKSYEGKSKMIGLRSWWMKRRELLQTEVFQPPPIPILKSYPKWDSVRR